MLKQFLSRTPEWDLSRKNESDRKAWAWEKLTDISTPLTFAWHGGTHPYTWPVQGDPGLQRPCLKTKHQSQKDPFHCGPQKSKVRMTLGTVFVKKLVWSPDGFVWTQRDGNQRPGTQCLPKSHFFSQKKWNLLVAGNNHPVLANSGRISPLRSVAYFLILIMKLMFSSSFSPP